MIMLYASPATRDALSAGQRDEVLRDHDRFRGLTDGSGELLGAETLADPSTAVTVRIREGIPTVTAGSCGEAGEHLSGYYLVDCESRERAVELAALVPAGYTATEVRPLMNQNGTEM
ncbi:YciI family protein [Sphaerisporangium sp. TRM90804]|uniref:YciI family protein n=1 Tax=Sphaerisporangium sp. TRM90804 TaxID=3031113 RepID=UPI00244B3481|nr:YciI family protein [Sphaerisporangium sp. TRM90804]MDH2425266.1 YciI family protein [Sphaerisporangium sp. TRM90804]